MEEITSANFFRKPCGIRDLQDDMSIIRPSPIEVTKVVELSAMEYEYFTTHLLEDAPFITANLGFMSSDHPSGITRCLLVTARERHDGILVDSQGYDYARYAAYVPDKSRLELRDVPVDHHGPREKAHRSSRER